MWLQILRIHAPNVEQRNVIFSACVSNETNFFPNYLLRVRSLSLLISNFPALQGIELSSSQAQVTNQIIEHVCISRNFHFLIKLKFRKITFNSLSKTHIRISAFKSDNIRHKTYLFGNNIKVICTQSSNIFGIV